MILKNLKAWLKNLNNRRKSKKLTFDDISIEWLNLKKKTIKKSTYYKYLYNINKKLLPKLKGKAIYELVNYDFDILIDEFTKELSPKTISDILIILRSILQYAVDKYKCDINIKNIKAPKQISEPLVILNKEEREKLESYCINKNTLRTIGILICLNTGIRIGELCALKWENINLEKKELYVRETIQRVYDAEKQETVVIKDKPKTQSSIRNIPISTKLYDILKEIKSAHNPEEYFLTGSINKFVEPRNYQNTFKSVLRKSKIKTSYKFHILRHSFATECIRVGMDVKTLSEILGHSNIQITLKIYVHSSYETKKEYLEKL